MKDYKLWHKLKFYLNNKKPRVYFYESEVWFCYLGENIGYEQDGRGQEFLRPIIVIKKFNNQIFWAIPLTKNHKNGKYYFTFFFSKNKKSTAILSQLRLLDTKRLKYKIGRVEREDMNLIKRKIKHLLA